MTFTIRFTEDSKKDYIKLDNSQQIQIRKSILKLVWIVVNPLKGN